MMEADARNTRASRDAEKKLSYASRFLLNPSRFRVEQNDLMWHKKNPQKEMLVGKMYELESIAVTNGCERRLWAWLKEVADHLDLPEKAKHYEERYQQSDGRAP